MPFLAEDDQYALSIRSLALAISFLDPYSALQSHARISCCDRYRANFAQWLFDLLQYAASLDN